MEKLKFALFSIVTLSLLGLLFYWSIHTIQSGTQSVSEQKMKQLTKDNEDLKKEIVNLRDEINILKPKLVAPAPTINEQPAPTVYKYQDLINELQKLITDKIPLRLKSSGARVGTVQKFLNIYNNTSNKVDNIYSTGTQKAVIAFQKDMGLTADGEAGSGTFSKMIDWLKQQM